MCQRYCLCTAVHSCSKRHPINVAWHSAPCLHTRAVQMKTCLGRESIGTFWYHLHSLWLKFAELWSISIGIPCACSASELPSGQDWRPHPRPLRRRGNGCWEACDKLETMSTSCLQFVCVVYIVSTLCMCVVQLSIYTVCGDGHNADIMSTYYLYIVYMMSRHVYIMSTHHLHKVYIVSTHCLYTVYIMSTHYLHNIHNIHT